MAGKAKAAPARKPPAKRKAKAATVALKTGRPTIYTPAMDIAVEALSWLGRTNAQMAERLAINEDTFYQWLIKHPSFSEAVEVGRDQANAIITKSLFERARGYQHPAEKIMSYEGQVIRAEYTERYAPDTAAATFWLKNRDPERWADKQNHEVDLHLTIRRALLQLGEDE